MQQQFNVYIDPHVSHPLFAKDWTEVPGIVVNLNGHNATLTALDGKQFALMPFTPDDELVLVSNDSQRIVFQIVSKENLP